MGALVFAGAVIAAIIHWGCSSGEPPAPLAPLDGKDDGGAGTGGTGGADSGTGGVSGDSGKDAISENPPADAKADVVDASPDAPADAKPDSYVEAGSDADDSGVMNSFKCIFKAQELNGPPFSSIMESISSVSSNASGFTGLFRYRASAGTDPALENARQNDRASTWPDKQYYPDWTSAIPGWAGDLTGQYELTVSESGGKHFLNLRTLKLPSDAGIGGFESAALFAMTFHDSITNAPQPIGDGNEKYPAAESELGMEVICNADCTTVDQAAPLDMTTLTGNKWSELYVHCEKQ